MQLEREVDEVRRKLQSLKTEKQNALLVSTSVLQANQSELEKIRQRAKQEEEEKLTREDKKKDISRELSQITQAIRNLFGRCFSTMRIKPVFAGQKETASISDLLDFELDIIHLRIADLIEIAADYRAAAAESSSAPPHPPATTDLRDVSVFSGGATGNTIAPLAASVPAPTASGNKNTSKSTSSRGVN